jgi:competence protein ComEA
MVGPPLRRTDDGRWASSRLSRVLPRGAWVPEVGPVPDAEPDDLAGDPPDPPDPPEPVDPLRRPGAADRLRAALATRIPPALLGGRLTLDRRAVAGLALVASLAVVLGLGYLRRAAPVGLELPAVAAPSVSAADSGARPSAAADVVVDVAGKVRRPGIVRLSSGARVVDALTAAGGALPGVDLTPLNLARRLVDGEQVLVGAAAATPAAPGGGTAGRPAGTGGQLDLNAATVEQLQALPGVGPVLAQRIVDWRTEHGRFSTVDELREVSGIGAKKFADLKDRVRV